MVEHTGILSKFKKNVPSLLCSNELFFFYLRFAKWPIGFNPDPACKLNLDPREKYLYFTQIVIKNKSELVFDGIADTGCLSRIQKFFIPDPDPKIFFL
jgi:hypothetical protein